MDKTCFQTNLPQDKLSNDQTEKTNQANKKKNAKSRLFGVGFFKAYLRHWVQTWIKSVGWPWGKLIHSIHGTNGILTLAFTINFNQIVGKYIKYTIHGWYGKKNNP